MSSRYGIPFIVKLRACKVHAIVFAAMLAVFAMLFWALCGPAVQYCAEVRRFSSYYNEAVIGGGPYGEEVLYYLNPKSAVRLEGGNGKVADCDIYMTLEGEQYGGNPLLFEGVLAQGTCAVSRNLAQRYGLEIGQTARIYEDKNIVFTVAAYLPAQAGLDNQMLRDGVAVLAYSPELLELASKGQNGERTYMAFDRDADDRSYFGQFNLMFLSDLRAQNLKGLLGCAAVFAVGFLLAMFLCERFICPSVRAGYAVCGLQGKKGGRLYLRALAHAAVKYLLPYAAVCAISCAPYACYGPACALPFVIFGAFIALTAAVYTFIITRRVYTCKIKRRC